MTLIKGTRSIRVGILGGFAVAGLLPLVGALLVYDSLNSRSLRATEFKKIREVGREAVRQITTIMDRASTELDGVASNPVLLDQTQTSDNKLEEMKRLVRVNRHFFELTLYNRTGFVLGSTNPDHAGDRERSRWFRRALKSGEKSITSPNKIIGEDGLFVKVFTPLKFKDGIDQIITARVRFEEISSLVAGINLGASGELVLLDEFGNVLAGRNQSKILRRFDTDRPIMAWLKANKGIYNFKGKPCLFTSHPMGPTQTKVDRPWTLLCFEPVEEVEAILADNRSSQMFAGLGGLLLACALGLFISRHLSRPIERAVETAQAINQGDFTVRMPDRGPTEIRRLAGSINSIIEDLTQYRDDMESKVASRTRSLRDVQETLKQERASLAERVELRTQELRAANKELARTAQMKDEFLAGMSHELRTPLNAILGLTESLEEGTYGQLSTRQLDRLKIIDESGRHLLALINDILDIAKIESGEMHLEPSEVEMGSLVKSCMNLVKPSAAKKGITLQYDLDSKAKTLMADERRLKQILVNLLSNSIKFTSTGSVGLEISANEEERTIDFLVWDTGIGIPTDQIDRLFQPFVQLDSSLAREYEGTGLGLALVYNFTEIHGGRVSAESKPDSGTRITVTLPWHQAQDEDHTSSPKGYLKAKSICLGKILLADDNESERLRLAKTLNRSGYEVHMAHDGASAVEMARLVEPNIILMDIQMPGMDGLEATHHLRGELIFRHTPIIGLTSLNTPSDIRRIHDAGMTDCVLKPAYIPKLINILDFYIDKAQRKNATLETSAA